jgi:hypothetical protein
MEPYNHAYCRLNDPSHDLRVLVIKKNNKLEVEAELRQLGDESYDALSWCWKTYEGDMNGPSVPIHIIHHDRAYSFYVSNNLVAALKALRERDILRIWIDWICIDQSNLEERSNQVQLMSRIYGQASCVYVWLGDEKNDSDEAFKFIPRILHIDTFDKLTKDKENHLKWKAVKMLMMRDWFSRRWIIQEIALAKRAELLCGKAKMDWSVFANAVSLFTEFETGTRTLSEVMKALQEYDHVPDFFGNVSALSAAHLVEVTNRLFRQRNDDRRDRVLNLEYLVSTFTAFEATEARDIIYAILAIAKDTTPQTEDQISTTVIPMEEITKKSKSLARVLRRFAVLHLETYSASKPYNVNYSLPISDIYVEFVQFCIERSRQSDPTRALDILCRSWAPDPNFHHDSDTSHGHWRARFSHKMGYDGKPDMTHDGKYVDQSPRPDGDDDTIPSWIPSTENCPHGWTGRGEEGGDPKMIRKNPDSLVGNPLQRIYSASGSRGLTKNLRFEDGIIKDSSQPGINNTHYHSAFIEGFVLGSIDQLTDTSQGGQIPKKWSTLVKAMPGLTLAKGRAAPRANLDLWEHPAADDFWRTLIGDRSWTGGNPPRYYQLILQKAYKGDNDVDLEKLIFWSKCQPAKDVCRRVHAVIWNRKLMSIKCSSPKLPTTKVLGLAPDMAETGDLVCILYGCSVPVVLRRYRKSQSIIESETLQRQERCKNEARLKIKNFIMTSYLRGRVKAVARKIKEDKISRRRALGEIIEEDEDSGYAEPPAKRQKRGPFAQDEPSLGTQPSPPSHPAGSTHSHFMAPNSPIAEPPESDHTVFYRLIGECYVHRMMNGEAIDYQNVAKLPRILFEIR